MSDIIERVDHILKNNDKLSTDFGYLSKVYLMTTENIKDFLQRYNLHNREILTVAGSGDQMLNAYLMGAKNVTCFDINPLAFYQVKLKKAAICTLSYDEFINFFIVDNGSCLRHSLYKKIEKELDDDARYFFEYLYSQYNNKEIFKKIYYKFKPDIGTMRKMNAYLEEDNYKKLSSILKDKEISFIQSNVTNLKIYIAEQHYDMILLSNISDSIENIYSTEPLRQFKGLIYSLSNCLNQNGIIQVGYIYYSHDNIFSDNEQRQQVFTTDEFHSSIVESYDCPYWKDKIITFQKINTNN